MKCEILTDEAAIRSLAPAWRDLHARVGLCPYTDYDMALLWWDHIGKPSGGKLAIAVCYVGDKLVGLIPFYIRCLFGVRQMFILGAGDIFYYRRFLVENPDYALPLWECVVRSRLYDWLDVKNIHHDSVSYDFFVGRYPLFKRTPSYFRTQKGETRQQLLAQSPKSTRRRLRAADKELQKKAGLELGAVPVGEWDDAVVDFILTNKKDWVQKHRVKSILKHPNGLAFYKALLRHATQENKARLFWLKRDGRLVAASLSLMEKKTVYAELVAYEDEIAHFAPGHYLSLEEMLWANQQHYTETNYKEGAEPYKKIFCNESRYLDEYIVTRTIRGYLFNLAFRLSLKIQAFIKERRHS